MAKALRTGRNQFAVQPAEVKVTHTKVVLSESDRMRIALNDYRKSEAWRESKARYIASGRPMRCAWCDSGRAKLIHLRYDQIPDEPPEHLLCLCTRHVGLLMRAWLGKGAMYEIPRHVQKWLPPRPPDQMKGKP